MTTLAEAFANTIGAWRAGPVQRSAAAYGGHCTYAFTQCSPPVSTFIGQDSSTSGGVCESLSAHWIYYHANDDSLWNWLMVGGQVSLSRLQYHVMQLQSAGILSGDQHATTEAWLRTKNILRRQSSYVASAGRPHRQLGYLATRGGSAAASHDGSTSLFSAGALAAAIVRDDTRGAGSYKKPGLYGKAGDHAMALFVAQDVVFFDPNFGEFWFADKHAFTRWFTGSFWTNSLYNVGLSGRFDLLPYAKANSR